MNDYRPFELPLAIPIGRLLLRGDLLEGQRDGFCHVSTEGHRQLSSPPACGSAPRRVVGWDDGICSRPLCRLSVSLRDYQPRRLAVFPVPARAAYVTRRRSWCISTDPAFAQKAAEIVGLYLQPPENAVVISVDEKPHIQALERAQGWLKLPNGRAVTGFSHAYKRHGTTTLFAALDVATGLVKTGHYQRRRRVEFLDFMNRLVAEQAGREIHVILDNLNTHKPKHDRWLARHKNVHFHFTPTHASWLNQVEVWFSILSARALAGASFTSPRQVRDQIDAFINAYNQTAHPFEWTKQVVFSQHPRAKYADLCN